MVPVLSERNRNRLWADKRNFIRAVSPDGGNIMTTGTVKRLVGEHGYGFVSSNAGKDIFFHYSQLDGIKFGALREGQYVSYKVGLGEKGFVAKDVKPCRSV
jgi:CspA family cold shock protein